MPLHTDYRPQTFDEVVGSETAVNGLQALLAKKSPNRSILLHGASGCGKTTLARVVARELGLDDQHADYHELNASDFKGIDMVRGMRKDSQYRPMSGVRVWLLDEAHMLTRDAQEALLKLLEHPPADTWFILATTNPEKLKITLRRRCAQFQVEDLTDKQITRLCKVTAKKEGKKVGKDILSKICDESLGSPGMALSILDTIIDLPEDEMMSAITVAAETQNSIIELCRAMMGKPNWEKLVEILAKLEGEHPESVRRVVREYYRKVMMGGNVSAYPILDEFDVQFHDQADLLLACYRATCVE